MEARDIPAVLLFGADLWCEAPAYRHLPFSGRRLADVLTGAIALQAALVAEDAVGLVGIVIGYTTHHLCSEAVLAGEVTLYVTPRARGTWAAVRLVHALEAWARERDAEHLTLGISTGIHPSRTVRLYRRLGFAFSGFTLVKRLRAP